MLLAVDERRQSEQHADAGRTKAVTPAEGFAGPRAQHAGDHAAEIDAGVVDREARFAARIVIGVQPANQRSEEHTSELQSLMRISYAVFCLKKKTHNKTPHHH